MTDQESKEIQITEFIGKTFTKVTNRDNCEISFYLPDGTRFVMYHAQKCCETVTLEDICGELEWLENSEILGAEEVSNYEDTTREYSNNSHTWTFYKLHTAKGFVTLRWLGESNGYYSERVSIYHVVVETN